MPGFNSAITQSNVQDGDPFDVDSITINRYQNQISGLGAGTVSIWSWSGVADLQEGGGQTYYSDSGAVEEADAMCIIDTTPFPAVEVGDVVTNAADGKSFVVKAVATMTFDLPFLRLLLQRGPIGSKGHAQ